MTPKLLQAGYLCPNVSSFSFALHALSCQAFHLKTLTRINSPTHKNLISGRIRPYAFGQSANLLNAEKWLCHFSREASIGLLRNKPPFFRFSKRGKFKKCHACWGVSPNP